MPKRAVLYARVSGDDARKEDRNLNAQLAMCREYAAARGYQIVAELAEDDRGASGAAFELPQLNRVRELAGQHAIDVVVVRDLDRLSRRLAKQLFVEYELSTAGVALEYVLASYEDNAEGNLIKNVRASVAEFERLKIVERMTRGRRLKAQQGNVLVGAHAPFGYRSVKLGSRTELEIDADEAAVVRQIYAWYLDGVTIRQIQTRLTAAGTPSFGDRAAWQGRGLKHRPAGAWAAASVHQILKNETYRGVWRYGKKGAGVPVEVAVPAIVGDDVWQAAQDRRAYNFDASPRSVRGEYLMRRRARCGLCGIKCEVRRVTKEGREIRAYYFCPARRPDLLPYTCTLPGFQAQIVDALVWGWVRDLLLDPEALENGLRRLGDEQAAAQAPLRARLARAEAEVDRLAAEQVELAAMYLRKKLPEEALDKLGATLAADLAARRAEVTDMRRQVQPATLTEARIVSILAFAAGIAADLDLVEADFALRRWVIEVLDVWVVLGENDAGDKTVEAAIVFSDADVLSLGSSTIHSLGHKPHAVVLRRRWELD